MLILMASGIFCITGNYKTYVKNTIDDDEFLTLIGVMGLLVNGVCRFFWNLLFLKTGYKFVMTCLMSISVIVLSTIRFTVESKPGYTIEFLLIHLAMGGLQVMTPTVVHAIFGVKIGSNVNGFFWCSVSLGNWVGYLLVSNLSKTIGFNNIFYICLGMAVLSFPIFIFYRFEGPWKNSLINLGWFPSWQM